MTDTVLLQRLLLITLIAGAIGYERERHGRAAGFRTHLLVGIGSCIVMLTGLYLTEVYAGRLDVDPTRMASQVISGIGFLGAGTILRSRASVRGLTTAASLWATAGVGLAAGAGFVRGALWTGLIVFVVLFGFSRLERLMRRQWYQRLVVETSGSMEALASIRRLLSEYEIEIRDIDVTPGKQPPQMRLEFELKLLPDHPREELIEKLRASGQVAQAHWA